MVVLARNPKMAAELDSHKRSPLHLASAEGHSEIVRVSLEANMPVCLVCDQEGSIPLHLAVMRGRVEVIEELMSAKLDSVAVKVDGETALHLCVKDNHLDALKLIIENQNSATTSLNIQEILKEAVVKRTNYLRADVVEPVVEPDSAAAASWFKKFKKYCNYQSNRLEEIRGSLMVVAATMATMSFLAVIRPRGGVWQQDSTNTTSPYSCQAAVCTAGTSVLADTNPVAYMNFMAIDAVAFVSSLSVILLIVTGIPFRNKLFTWMVITWMMMLSTYAMTLMYDGWP